MAYESYDYKRMGAGMTFIPNKPFVMSIAEGEVAGYSYVEKFGHNPDIDSGSVPETIWDNSDQVVYPTAARIHDFASTSAQDVGTLVSTGTATGGSKTTIIDTGATFLSDHVAAGDTVINDTTMEHSVVVTVDSETQITTENTRHGDNLTDSGDTYRVVSPAGTGASVVHIKQGLDGALEPLEEFVITNGTTNVPTLNEYLRIPRVHIEGAASAAASNVGDITATAQTDGTVTAIIGAGEGQTAQAFYTVPAGKTAWLENWWGSLNRKGSTAGAMVDIELWVTPHAISGASGSRLGQVMALSISGTSSDRHDLGEGGIKFEHETDIEIRCVYTSDNNVKMSAGFRLRIKDNE